MAKHSVNSGLAARLGTAGSKAIAGHRNDEVDYGVGSDLPPGISGGIAQLTECKFGVYKTGPNKGEYFFMASATVIEPKVHNRIKVEGLRTQIGPEPICDTPDSGGKRKTLDDHLAWVLNEFRKLGVDTKGLEVEDLEATAQALKEEAPYIRFETWQGEPTPEYPNPRVNHKWKGTVAYDSESTDDVVDQTEGDEDEGHEAETEPETVYGESADEITALGEAADGGDEGAMEKLAELARGKGFDPDEIETWAEVAEMITGDSETGASGESNGVPEKGQLWFYRPPKHRKAIECEVTAVFDKSETVNLKSLDDGTSFKSIAFADLKENG